MRIPSGVIDQYIYFIAVDITDLKTRETGLSSFTVYRSRNGAAAAVMTTPTINETDATNMPGVYELLLDEDMTIGSGNDSEAMVFHITQASMAPVSREIELYRPKITEGNTLDVTATGGGGIDWGNIENKATANDLSGTDIQLVDTATTNTDMRGTDSAALASVLGALADAAAAGDPTSADTLMQYIKQLINTLEGAVGIPVYPAEAAPANNVSIAEAVLAIYNDTVGLAGSAMRGTDSGATATDLATAQADLDTITGLGGVIIDDSAANDTTLSDALLDETLSGHVGAGTVGKSITDIEADTNELQADDVPTLIAAVQSDTNDLQTRTPAALIGGRMDSDVEAINASTTAAIQLALSAAQIESGVCEGTPSTTVIQTDLAETQDDIYIGRVVIFTSGNARGEATDITDYTGSTGTLTVTALANAPTASDTFILI